MQKLNISLMEQIKKTKIQSLESELKDVIIGEGSGHLFICPFCKYESRKNSKGSAKVFDDDFGFIFKCFNCGVWRAVR